MDENTNQPSTTPLGNERSLTPGQDNIASNNLPTLPNIDENTPLSDITKQYTDIGSAYTGLVENAADNVGDRQVQLVGNDFGATNPYMFNTYYEPAATSFASEMRQQGTQKALEVGLDRAEEEAQKNAQAAQSRYNNAVAAAKAREEQRKNAQMHISETDMSKLPEGVTEQEILNYYNTGKMSEDDVRNKYMSEGIKQIQEKSSSIDWNAVDKDGNSMRKPVSADTKAHFGITNDQWANMSKEERDAFWAREDVGNYWTRQYMINYFKEAYGESAGSMMVNSFNDLNERVDNVVRAVKNNDLSSLKTIDVDFAGVQINFTPEQEAERIKKAIRETDKLSDDEKQKYINTIEGKRIGGGGAEAFMKMWHEIESKQATMEHVPNAYNSEDYAWKKNGMQVDKKTYDNVWEIMKLFAETEENMGMSIAGSRGILRYADVEPDSKKVYSHTEGQLMDAASRKQLDNVMTRAFGIDVDSWEKMAKLASESPEDYEFLRDHASFVMAGGAGAFEQVEDGDKKYFINGKYWSANDEDSPISVGDFIFHTVDGTVNSEGEYSDPQLKEFISDYKKIYNGDLDASDENIQKLEANYNAYANRVARAMFLSGNYGTSVNENIYNVILALDGVSDDNLEFVNPSNPEEKMSVAAIKEWFNSLSDDAKYTAYTTISRKARESRGVMILSDDKTGQLYDAGISQNGQNTIGKYNEKESASDMRVANQLEKLSNEDCLALAFYIDNGMKDGTISNSFMDNEGVDISDAFFNSIYNNLKGCVQFFGAAAGVGAGSIGAAIGIKDKDGTNAAMRWGKEVWDDMTTMSEGDDWMHDSGQSAMNPYTQQMREQQRANLNHMIDTTFNLDYFNAENSVDPNTGEVKDKDGNVISLDNTHFNHMDQGKAFATGAATMMGAIAEFMLETALTAGAGKLLKWGAKGTSSLIRKGARAVAAKSPAAAAAVRASSKFVKATARFLTTPATKTAVQSALQASHATNYIDDVARAYGDDIVRGIAEGEIKSADDVVRAVGKTTEAANAAKSYADDAARATLKEAEKTAANGLKDYADDAAEAVAKGETIVDDIVGEAAEQSDDVARKLTKDEAQTLLDNVKKAQSVIQNDYAIRYGLDAVADNIDDAAKSLSQRILDKIESGVNNTHVFKGVNDSVRSLLKDNLTDAVARAAVNSRLAAKTGMSASRIANLSDDAASVLYGMLRATESASDDAAQYALRGVSRMQAAQADVVLKNVDFKKAAEKVVEASERLAIKGGELGLDDVFRLIATEGSINPGDLLSVLKRSDFVKDRVTDWSRDIAQNYWTPELDEHFESHYVDFDTYLHSPEQWLLSAGFDLGVTGATRIKNHLKLNFYESKIDGILGNIDLSTANKADRAKFRKQMVKLDNLRAKASKLNGQILERKISFDRVHDVADKAERAVKNQIDLMSDNIDITKTSDLIKLHSDDAMEEAKAALAKGGFGSKRKYKQILADADQFNRMIVRGNDRLAMVQEASQALQQVSVTRYLDIYSHSKTTRKLNGEQWGKTMSLAWKEITDENFAAKYGRTLGKKEDALGKAFDSRHTINFKNPADTKAAYAAGQTLVYDTIFKKVRKVMGNSLTKSEYADLRIELNGIRDRMIAAGNQMIDDGRKVRWNYMPTQALTWESEPGSMSAVRALWGWDYKGGVHMTPAGEIANPLLARDQWDFSNIIDDFDNGRNTFKRRKGDREIDIEKTKNPGVAVDEFKDVNYNWEGFNPAYACNAYLNSIDSARIIQPKIDPLNGVIVNSPAMAKNVLHTSNIVLDNELDAIEKKYKDRVDKEIAKRSKAKANRTSKVSLEHRAKLMDDFSNSSSLRKGLGADSEAKITKLQSQSTAADARIKQRIHESPMVKSLEPLYARNFINDRVPAEAKASYIIGKMDTAYNELGQDIKAVRDMYTKAGNIKKKYLNSDGTIKEAFRDAQGNLVPEGAVSGTFNNVNGTQYREFVNQLAQNKSLKSDYFESNSARIIKFDDGAQINANAFQKNIYDVLAAKQVIDLGMDPNYKVQLFPENTGYNNTGFDATELSISKRLQPIDLDSNKARSSLTSETRKIFDSLYGDWSDGNAAGKGKGYKIKRGSAKDKFFQNAISNAFDEAEATGGEITTYDFVQLVDKHIPDFVKEAGRKDSPNVTNFFSSLSNVKAYENSGGNAERLLRDLDDALDAERAAKKPNVKNIAALENTIDAIRGAYDYDQRTTNRASFNESLDYEINETDFGSDAKLTAGDVIADANTSGEVEGFSNLYVPKGVDENLISGTSEIAPEVDLEAYPNMKNAPGQSEMSLSDWMFTELNRQYDKPRYDDKTVSAIASKYQDKVAKAQTADEIAKVADEIASDLVPLDPGAKGSATELKHVTTDIQNAIFWLKESANADISQPAPVEKKISSNIGTDIKNALDILAARSDSDYASKISGRAEKREAYDTLKKSFYAIADKLDKKVNGKQIYRGNDILLGASDNQYLAFAAGDHTTPWMKGENPGGVDNATARRALIAGSDRAGDRSFGNINFWKPEEIDAFIKNNSISVDDKLSKEIDAYKAEYAAKASVVENPALRGRVSDTTLSLQNSIPEYIASKNDGSKSTFDLNKRSKKHNAALDYHNEAERYLSGDARVAREAEAASEALDRKGNKIASKTREGAIPQLSSLANPNVEYGLRMDESHNAPSAEAYEYDTGDVNDVVSYDWDEETRVMNEERARNTPYVDFLNQSKKSNISQAAVDLNEVFYGNGDKDGYFDYKNKLAQKIDEEMAVVSDNFDTNITSNVTALKELDGAKDGEVVDILKTARKQADEIENPDVKKYVIKRLDDEIEFAEKNLELTEKTKAKVAEAFAEHDPEYQAALNAKRQSNMKPTGAQISAAVPNGSNPVFVNGNMTPDGHITLQQLVDARNEMKLSRKNGKNTFKSSAETKKVLNAMRKEMEYDGSTLITEGPARRQDTWILNLYKRVYDSAGDPLPKVPTFKDLENGFMEYNGKKIKLDLKLSEIYIDPKIASLGHTYWGEGNAGLIENFYKAATAVSSFNKTIQDIQLAGGLGQYNAFTLRNAITMMWQDPIGGTRALFTNFRNARTNESVVQFYLKNHEKLLKMAIDTGDYSALNAFTNVINARDEVTGGGAIAEMGHAIMDTPDNIKKEGVIAGLWDTTSNTYKAMFNNPTFVRWAAVAKADMQLRNYDHATRFVNRIVAKYGLTDEDFANMEGGMGTKDRYIAHLAQMRTDRYWTPSKFITSGGNADKYLQKQNRLSIQQTADSLRGMPQKKTLRQCLSDFFFAIGYKLQMNAHPVVGIGSMFTALPNNLRASNAIRNRTSFSVMTSRFAGRGDRNEALVMIGIAALAHAWNTHIGAPSAFEELFGDHGKEEDGTYGIAQSLLNFQDFGKFWLPNTQNGTFDPTQRGASVDPFFSVFTLQNSAMRAANKAFFPNQIPINTQRTFYQEDNQSLISRVQGVSDELIGANLLSGYKAIYEVLNNSTYFGNNIWERKRLPDGSENPNYNPLRNLMASVAHIMNLEEVMLGDTTNRWVKGLDIDTKTWKDGEQVDPYSVGPEIGEAGKYNGRTGTVAGSGIIQHEYLTALKKANDGEYFDALTESMELPFKTRNYASRARTQLNTEVIAALRNAKKDYDNKVAKATPEEKDKIYAEFAEKAVNIMHDWSAKNAYVLGPNDELTSAATKILVSFMADEYDDVTNRVQNRYDKLRQELKMADGDQFLFSKAAMEAAIADGMSDSEAAELHNKHLTALKEAQIKEYDARQALIKAGLDPNVFDTVDYINDDASAKSASFDKKTYTEILGKLEAPIGEFKNYKEMKAYYETRISEATTTKQKAKLANMYNEQVLGVIAPYIEAGYGAAAFNNIYWDGDNLSNKLGPYIILPADKYYGGKYPRTNYLKDMLGIGYRDNKNLPSDKQIDEQLHKVAVSLSKGNISSASALVDNALVQLRKGYWHAAPADYDKLIRMRALLSSRSK